MENFLVFKNKLEIEFASGVNVIIGENATGKTTLLKGMYACLQINNNKQNDVDRTKDDISKYFSPFARNSVFIVNKFDMPEADFDFAINENIVSNQIQEIQKLKNKVEELVNKSNNFHHLKGEILDFKNRVIETENTILKNKVKIDEFEQDVSKILPVELSITVESNNQEVVNNPLEEKFHTARTESLFIPPNDMLTHSKGFIESYEDYRMPFDRTQFDILKNARKNEKREISEESIKILDIAGKVIDGEIEFDGDFFYVVKNNGKKVEFSFEAEGLKKFGLIWKLIRNGLLEKDTVLFWDEPENSLNPKLMKELGEIILELSRIGVQVFLATHSGNIAREIAQQKNDTDSVEYFSLYREDEDDPYGEVFLEHDNRLDMLPHNVMQKADVDLYYRELGLEYDD
jgi:predicted ATP-dependent endonuclease of OLD family